MTSMLGWSFIASVTQFPARVPLDLLAFGFRLTGRDRSLEGGLVGLGWARSLGRPLLHGSDANEQHKNQGHNFDQSRLDALPRFRESVP